MVLSSKNVGIAMMNDDNKEQKVDKKKKSTEVPHAHSG